MEALETGQQTNPTILPRLLDGLAVVSGKRTASGRERNFLAFLDLADGWLAESLTGDTFLDTATILEACREREELAWMEHGRHLSDLLEHFDLTPRRNSAGKKRGYLLTREWLASQRASYPTPEEPKTTGQ